MEMASLVGSPANVTRAVYYLSLAPTLRRDLERLFGDGCLPETERDLSDYPVIKARVESLCAGSPDLFGASARRRTPFQEVSAARIVPRAIWADMLYLDAYRESPVPVDSFMGHWNALDSGHFQDTADSVVRRTDASIVGASGVLVTVRDVNPRRAEIYADAIAAAYVSEERESLQKAFEKRCDAAEARRAHAKLALLAAFRKTSAANARVQRMKAAGASGDHVSARLAEEWSSGLEAGMAQEEYRAATQYLARLVSERLDLDGRVPKVAYWAGPPPGTSDHPMTPATAHPDRRPITIGAFAGLLFGLTLALRPAFRRPDPIPATDTVPEPSDPPGADTF